MAKLSIGAALPAYDFGYGNSIDLTSCVKVGTNIAAEISYYYNWHFGFGFMLNYNLNPVDESRLADNYMNRSPAFKTVSAKSEAFRDVSGLGGFVFDLPVTDILMINFKMFGGLRNIYKPTALIETTTVFSNVNYYETHNNQLVVAFLFSGGLKLVVNDDFNVHLDASYMGSKIEFEYLRNSTTINQPSHIGILNFAGGVSYNF